MKITKKNIEASYFLRNQMLQWNLLYDLLTREFTRCKLSNNIHEIGYKVKLIDKLYNCNLMQDYRKVAIVLLKLDLDSLFEKSDFCSIVNKISEIKFPSNNDKKKYRRIREVFASKYCHFHFPNKFPITDSFSKIALSKLLKKEKRNCYDNNYTQFFHDINDLKKSVKFEINYAEIDGYLWLYGQWLKFKDKDKCSNAFRYLIEHEKELFELRWKPNQRIELIEPKELSEKEQLHDSWKGEYMFKIHTKGNIYLPLNISFTPPIFPSEKMLATIPLGKVVI